MRTLVLGAGAVGGYFGGRLAGTGADVTFLVRPRRAAVLAARGLAIASPAGDAHVAAPRTLLDARTVPPFDLVLLACKAYDLDGALDALAPAVGPGTAIVPLVNGLRHLDGLVERFGEGPVLGGWCAIAATLDAEGGVRHLNALHTLAFGERDGADSPRVQAIAAHLAPAGFDVRPSRDIVTGMWEKWCFIAALAGITCLMRANVAEILAAGGADLALALADECRRVAEACGRPIGATSFAKTREFLTTPAPLTASMLRDVEGGGPTECEHVLGDLLQRGTERGLELPLLRVATTHLRAHEARRAARPA